ncbi:MAG TPA: phosphatase PAP2 family protein [Candidatus Nanoarchaeia archaeon]|nr:phosphatase PAP2 family protein [Candidatus Nanoarchaeia archaeon]
MKKICWFLAFILALGISLIYDKQIVLFFYNHRIAFLDPVFAYIIKINRWILLALLTIVFARKLRHVLIWWLTFAATLGVSYVLKDIFSRLRPADFFSSLGMNIGLVPTSGLSFPSGHAVTLAASIPLVSKYTPKLKNYWIAIVSIILFARVYGSVHYFSDIFTGCLIGYFVGVLILKLESKVKFLK